MGGVAVEDASAAGAEVDSAEDAGVASDGFFGAELVGWVVDTDPSLARVDGAVEAFCVLDDAGEIDGGRGLAGGGLAEAEAVDGGEAFEGGEGDAGVGGVEGRVAGGDLELSWDTGGGG